MTGWVRVLREPRAAPVAPSLRAAPLRAAGDFAVFKVRPALRFAAPVVLATAALLLAAVFRPEVAGLAAAVVALATARVRAGAFVAVAAARLPAAEAAVPLPALVRLLGLAADLAVRAVAFLAARVAVAVARVAVVRVADFVVDLTAAGLTAAGLAAGDLVAAVRFVAAFLMADGREVVLPARVAVFALVCVPAAPRAVRVALLPPRRVAARAAIACVRGRPAPLSSLVIETKLLSSLRRNGPP